MNVPCGRFGGIGILICLALRLNSILGIDEQTFEGVITSVEASNPVQPAPSEQIGSFSLGEAGFDRCPSLSDAELAVQSTEWYKDVLKVWNELNGDKTLSGSPLMEKIAHVLKDIELYIIREYLLRTGPTAREKIEDWKLMKVSSLAELFRREGSRILEDLIEAFLLLDNNGASLNIPNSIHKLQEFILDLGWEATRNKIISIAKGPPLSVDLAEIRRAMEKFLWPKFDAPALADSENFIGSEGIWMVLSSQVKVSNAEKFAQRFGIELRPGVAVKILEHYLEIYQQKLSNPEGKGPRLCMKIKKMIQAISTGSPGLSARDLESALSDIQASNISESENLFFHVFLYQIWSGHERFYGDESPAAIKIKNTFGAIREGLDVFQDYLEIYRLAKENMLLGESEEMHKSHYLNLINAMQCKKVESPEESRAHQQLEPLRQELSRRYSKNEVWTRIYPGRPLLIHLEDKVMSERLRSSGEYEMIAPRQMLSPDLMKPGFPKLFYDEAVTMVQGLLETLASKEKEDIEKSTRSHGCRPRSPSYKTSSGWSGQTQSDEDYFSQREWESLRK